MSWWNGSSLIPITHAGRLFLLNVTLVTLWEVWNWLIVANVFWQNPVQRVGASWSWTVDHLKTIAFISSIQQGNFSPMKNS